MSYIYLALAIAFEVAGTTAMKFAEGFSKPLPSVLVFVLYGLSIAALVMTLKYLQLSIVYAIWAGIGTALIVAIAFIWFDEPVTVVKLISIALIVLGVVGLNLAGESHA